MKHENLLTISVVLLLLLNFGTLGYLFFGKHHSPPPPRVDKVIIETLHWNEEQQQQFDKLKHEHRDAMNKLDEQNEEVARKYFALLNSSLVDTAQKNLLEREMAEIETQKANITFHHLEDLKKICTPEQAKNFAALVPQLIEILIPTHHKSGPPPDRRD